jgi:5-methylthioadenosine/S-adenosylhomocysteine deaminase
MDDRDTEHARADILVSGTTIAAVGPSLDVPRDRRDLTIIDAAGLLAMPGLINAHVHSPGNFMKGALDGRPLEIFMLQEVPPFSDTPPSPRLHYVRTMLGILEMLKLGVTAAHDDAFFVPVVTEAAIDGLMQAYADSGMRARVALDQPNVVEYEKYPFLEALLPAGLRQKMAAARRQSTAELLDLYRVFLDRWNGACAGRLGVAVSCSAPQRATPDYLEGLAALSRAHDLPFNAHILETKLQRVLGAEKYGKSLVRYVHDLNLLDERMQVIHAIWIDAADIDFLATAGCSVAHNPVCNLRLGSGIMPFRRLRAAGVNICLGSDEAAVDDTANMWGVAKLAGLLHTLTDPDDSKWPTAPEILWALIRGGARAMRLHRTVGVLAPGYEADLILVDLNTLAFTPLNDLRRQLVYCETGASVVLTMVAGRIVVDRGRVLTVDEEAIKAEARELMPAYRDEMARAAMAARELEPYYREMYARAATRDVGMTRWAGSAET